MSASRAMVSRRELLSAAAALPALLVLPAGCKSVALPPAGVDFADMHIHLFNAHDLPVGKFLTEVLFRKQPIPNLLKAVIDTIVRMIQPLAISARAEKERLEGTLGGADAALDWTPSRFGREVGNWARDPAGEPAMDLFEDRSAMRAAYDELIAAVIADADSSAPAAGRPDAPRANGSGGQDAALERAFARLARQAEAPPEAGGASPSTGAGRVSADRRTPECGTEACPDRPYSMSVGAILRYLGWGYLMLKSREAHLADYVRMSRRHGEQPRLILNHLVDYDEWLGDARLQGSSHSEQAEVAAALARAFAIARPGRPPIELKTFAGFCPLKHALEVRRLGRPVSFEAQLADFDRGRIAGFKLYPPMGFRPLGNAALANAEFDPRSPRLKDHFDRWSAALGATQGGYEIGRALDSSLTAFFSACAARDIPLMAHASHGNEAGPQFGHRANPSHWYEVARRHRIRLSLGHLVYSAEDFVCAVRAGAAPACVWALGASRLLLDPAHGLDGLVYGDLGYMPELIDNPALAAEFFLCLKQVYGARDSKLTRILYGSDYVMIGTMPDYDRHLGAIRRGMADASYDGETIANVLFNNARRFLTRLT